MKYLTIVLAELHSGVQLERVVCHSDFVNIVLSLLDEHYHWENDVNSIIQIYTNSNYGSDMTPEFKCVLERFCKENGFELSEECKLWSHTW